MKLSIIIPVFRTQDTLDRCIESILRQSFTDYEIILVDDGSPDRCPQLCDDYANKYTHISVIHKENGGLSDARNAGIEQAVGEYITFIDSDDTILEDTLQKLMEELQEHPTVDILEYPVMERVGHPTKEKLLTFIPKEYENALTYWLGEKAYNHTYAWNKIFRRSLFKDIRFPKGKNFEDVLTIPLLIGLIPYNQADKQTGKELKTSLHIPKIRVTNVGMYLYNWNEKGITAKAKYEDLLNLYIGHTMSLLQMFKTIKERDKEILGLYQEAIEDFMVKILNVLLDLYDLSGTFETTPPLISRVKWLSEKTSIKSLKLKLLNFIGYHQLCRLNHLIHKIYRHHS